MSYFIVKGCSTLFNSLEEANKKALEIANKKLSESLIISEDVEVVESYFDEHTGNTEYSKRVINSSKLRPINSKQELLDLATEFDFITSTYVVELFHKEELIQQ